MNTGKDILKEEIELLIEDIINAYEQSGKKTSGKFPEGLEIKEKPLGFELWGYGYLAGRPSGRMPPVEELERWVKLKGLSPIEDNAKASSIAWAIAKKIAKEGTDDDSSFPIYETVITPARIDKIIEKVAQFHAAQFVEEVQVNLITISQKYKK